MLGTQWCKFSNCVIKAIKLLTLKISNAVQVAISEYLCNSWASCTFLYTIHFGLASVEDIRVEFS